jgi:hypothetical protein
LGTVGGGFGNPPAQVGFGSATIIYPPA